jgi:glucosamine--fructose-6-phosphate aminotransferase (isomerizing)
MVSSEQSGFSNYVNNYISINDNDIICLEKKNGTVVYNKHHNYKMHKITNEFGAFSPDPYAHWTIREINEQYDAALKAINMGSRLLNNCETKLGGFEMHAKELIEIDNLIILGCGTSYHSSLYSSHIFKEIAGFNTVSVHDGANFSTYDIPKSGKTALIFVSQSGETKDLYRCISIGKDKDLLMIGVINVVDSQIAREVHCGVYLNAGREVAVASTKAFTSQCIVLHLIAIWFSQNKNGNNNIHKRSKIIEDLRRLPIDIKSTIDLSIEKAKNVAKTIYENNSLFILGKDKAEAIAKEGALKIKEITCIHAEGYSCAALKHGPLSLVGPNVPTIMINIAGNNFLQNQAIGDELVARDCDVYVISDEKPTNKYKDHFLIPSNQTFADLLSVIPLQLLAYEIALLKNLYPFRLEFGK